MARIIIGGFQHETNTFAPSKAELKAFTIGGGWPALVTGPDMFEAVKGINISVAGFIDQAQDLGHELVATSWGAASPSAHVTEEAYEHIAGLIVDSIRAHLPADAIYLCLHGAMVSEHFEDGEGELLARVRKAVGPDIPVVASLDLHCNTTPEMMQNATGMIAYRTYPHIDMADTGARTARYLDGLLRGSGIVHKAFRQSPFLIPLTWQCTMMQPAQGIYEALEVIERDTGAVLSFTPGFPAADIHHCGPAIFGYAASPEAAETAVQQLSDLVDANESKFAGTLYEPLEGVRHAYEISRTASRPVVIADTQDNPGAGGDSDTMGMLRALLEAEAENAAIGLIYDPEVAEVAHKAGEGSEINVALGAKSKIPGDEPLSATFKVGKLSDGRLDPTGPFYKGARMNLGPSARLEIGGVEIVLGSRTVQMADQEMYRYVGIEPTAKKVLVNKSSVHFRADFAPIAEEILVCTAPGPMVADPADLPWTRLRSGIRLNPLGPVR